MDKQKTEILKVGDRIDFLWMDDTPGGRNLGRAEFEICPVFKYGYLREIHISARQQRPNRRYIIPIEGKVNQLQICEYGEHRDLNHWMNYWCKEHKTLCQVWYVPTNSKSIRIEPHFGDSISLEFHDD